MNNNEIESLKADIVEMFTADPKELQKKYREEAKSKYREKLGELHALWNVGDKAWLVERKRHWSDFESHWLSEGGTNSELKKYKAYFIRGEREDYIPPQTLYLMTPVDSVEAARRFFSSSCLDNTGRDSLLNSLFGNLFKKYGSLDFLKNHVEYLAKGIMSILCDEKGLTVDSGEKYRFTSFDFLVDQYIFNSILALRGDSGVHGVAFCDSHFSSWLLKCKEVNLENFNTMLDFAEYPSINCHTDVKEFSKRLVSRKEDIVCLAEPLHDRSTKRKGLPLGVVCKHHGTNVPACICTHLVSDKKISYYVQYRESSGHDINSAWCETCYKTLEQHAAGAPAKLAWEMLCNECWKEAVQGRELKGEIAFSF